MMLFSMGLFSSLAVALGTVVALAAIILGTAWFATEGVVRLEIKTGISGNHILAGLVLALLVLVLAFGLWNGQTLW